MSENMNMDNYLYSIMFEEDIDENFDRKTCMKTGVKLGTTYVVIEEVIYCRVTQHEVRKKKDNIAFFFPCLVNFFFYLMFPLIYDYFKFL